MQTKNRPFQSGFVYIVQCVVDRCLFTAYLSGGYIVQSRTLPVVLPLYSQGPVHCIDCINFQDARW